MVDAVTSVDEIVDALATDYLGALERLASLPVKASPIHV